MKPADDEAVAASAAEQGVLSEAAPAVEQPCVVGAAPVAATKWQAFTRITAVQQALVLFVGSVAYDAGSVAYLVDLLTASVFFLLASALFVIGLGLDLREMKQTRAEALRVEANIASVLHASVRRRWVALVLNTSGGVVSLVASVHYLRASAVVSSFQGSEDELHLGDLLFAVGMWLFSLGTAVLLGDVRASVVAVARAREVEVPSIRQDRTLRVLAIYFLCLVTFGVASTLYILPSDTTQTVGVALFVVSNVSFTAINLVALWYLWTEHSAAWDSHCEQLGDALAAEEGASVQTERGAPAPDAPSAVDIDRLTRRPSQDSPLQRRASGEHLGREQWQAATSLTGLLLQNLEHQAEDVGRLPRASPRVRASSLGASVVLTQTAETSTEMQRVSSEPSEGRTHR